MPVSDSTPHSVGDPGGRAGGRPGRVGRAARRAPVSRAGGSGTIEERLRRVPWWAGWCCSSPRSRLFPLCRAERLRAPRRVRHGALHAARARPERRRRLGRSARPRVRRLLRDRRVHVRDLRLESSASTCRRSSAFPCVVVRRRADRALVGLPSRTAERRLPGDRDAVLPRAVRDGGDERRQVLRPQHHRRAVRDPQRRSVQLLRPLAGRRSTGHLRRVVLYVALAVLRDRVRGAAFRQQLPDGSRVAVAPRGSAGRRGDGHAGQLAEAGRRSRPAPPSRRSPARSRRH